MFTLKLSAVAVVTPTGVVARVTDLTDWSQAVSVRASWAIFLTGTQLASVQTQDVDLVAMSYEPHTFQSGANPVGTVDVPLPSDGIIKLQAVAAPLLLSTAELVLATVGRVYYRSDTSQFIYKQSALLATPVTTWTDVVAAANTDFGEPGGIDVPLLEKSAVVYVLSDYQLQAALAKLNLRYLEAGSRQRTVLQQQYSQVTLLLSGAGRQVELGLYADSGTTLLAARRLLGACLPEYAQSLPALGADDCGYAH